MDTKNTVIDKYYLITSARSSLYHFFSLACADPQAKRFERLLDKDYRKMMLAASGFLREDWETESGTLAPGEMPAKHLDLRLVLSFLERPIEDINMDYQNTFGMLLSSECPPYETEYCPQTFSVYRSQQLADIGGFYHAFGLEPSQDRPERMDHISLELEFMAWLIAKVIHAKQSGINNLIEKVEICNKAQKTFCEKHLSWWTPAFCTTLHQKAEGINAGSDLNSVPKSFYGAVAIALAAFINMERNRMKIPPPTELLQPNPDKVSEEMSCDGCSFIDSHK